MSERVHIGMPPPDTVSYPNRPHVDSLMEEALQKRLITVVAGAGYGKTHAVSSALKRLPYRSAWLRLTKFDNSGDIFWERLTHVMKTHHPDLANHLISLDHLDSLASFHQFLRRVRGELKREDRFVFVLDNFHLMHNKALLHFFERLLALDIGSFSIVIISRKEPRLPLAGILAEGSMARVTEDDLRLSQDEMRAYYRMQGNSFSNKVISDLYAHTEGWMAAIYLIGLSLKGKDHHDPNPILLAKGDIFAFINEEIFPSVSKRTQGFLILLSLLRAVPAGLFNELASGSPGMLAEITDTKPLMRYDPLLDCYYMHSLFKDFLCEKRASVPDKRLKKVHMIAGKWFREHGQLEEAIHHYQECNCYFEIFDIILSVHNRVSKNTADAFITLIDRSPKPFIEARPIMRVAKALYLFNNNRVQEARNLLVSIRDEYEALEPTRDHLAVLGEAYMLLALISINLQNFDFVSLFKKADECLPEGSVLIDSQYDLAEGLNMVGIKEPIPGELQRYQAALFEAAPYAIRVMNGCGYGIEYLNATDVALMTGDIRSAEKYGYETIYYAQLLKQYTVEYMANYYLMRVFFYKGNYQKIALMLKQMKDQSERLQNPSYTALYDIIEGWFFVKVGQTENVAKWIRDEETTRKKLAPVVLGREYLVRSDSLLVEERYYELLGFMKQSDVFYEQKGILYALIQNKITESIIHHYLGDHKKSMEALETAYHLSEPNHLVFQYIEYGSWMRTVMQAALQDENCKIPRPWLENIQTKSSTYAKRLAQIIKDYTSASQQGKREQPKLSKRELEVLTCLCHGFTREEIADNFNLSPNTVRSTLQSIFDKLGAINSLDAVRIATVMNLV